MTTLANAGTYETRRTTRVRHDDLQRVNAAHLRVLLATDVRRLGPSFARSIVGVLALVVLAIVTGFGNRGLVTGLVAAMLVMYPMFLALQLVKDKLDGNLAFLCALPVTPETLAAVRVVPIVALSLCGGIGAAVITLWSGVPDAIGHGPLAVGASILLLGALVPSALASIVLALSARFSFETLASLPMLALLGLTILGKTVERTVPASAVAQLQELVAQPWAPVVLITILCGALIGTVVLAFRVTARTFARFTPERRGG